MEEDALESSSEDCNGVLGAHGMLRNASSILATADSAVGEAEVEGYHSTQALLLLAAAAAFAIGAWRVHILVDRLPHRTDR